MVSELSQDPHMRARELAQSLADGPAKALGQARRLLRQSWEHDRETVGAEEGRTIAETKPLSRERLEETA